MIVHYNNIGAEILSQGRKYKLQAKKMVGKLTLITIVNIQKVEAEKGLELTLGVRPF